MTPADTLRALRDAIQQDVGNRGLARDPADNLFTACPDDFAAACRSVADHPNPSVELVTGFFIPPGEPPAYETDGPLGAVFLLRAFRRLGCRVGVLGESGYAEALKAGLKVDRGTGVKGGDVPIFDARSWKPRGTHLIA